MLYFLTIFSKKRKFWFVLILSAIGFISIALFVQYFFLLKPCVLCIYQRCAFIGILIAGIIGLIEPNRTILRFLSILIWMFSAFKGLCLAKKNVNIILHPSPFSTCDLFVTFPEWLPLHKWWPSIFDVNGGNCLDYTWYFLSFEISQWMVFIFTSYLTLALCTMIAQFIYTRK